MNEVDEMLLRIRTHAENVYPPGLCDEYKLLEMHCSRDDRRGMLRSVERITSIKKTLNGLDTCADGERFFASLIDRVDGREPIPMDQLVALERAPERCVDSIVEIAKMLARQRAEASPRSGLL